MSYGSRGPPNTEGMTSLKVDNLTYRTRPEDLRRTFEKFGDVGDVYIPRDRFTKESRGFAFIRFYDKRDAEDAMDEMDASMMDGRELRVQMARYGRPTNQRYDNRRHDNRRNNYGGGGGGRDRDRRRSRSRSRDRHSRRRRSRSYSRSKSRSRSRSKSRSRSPTRSRSRSASEPKKSRSRSPSKSPKANGSPGGVQQEAD